MHGLQHWLQTLSDGMRGSDGMQGSTASRRIRGRRHAVPKDLLG